MILNYLKWQELSYKVRKKDNRWMQLVKELYVNKGKDQETYRRCKIRITAGKIWFKIANDSGEWKGRFVTKRQDKVPFKLL